MNRTVLPKTILREAVNATEGENANAAAATAAATALGGDVLPTRTGEPSDHENSIEGEVISSEKGRPRREKERSRSSRCQTAEYK